MFLCQSTFCFTPINSYEILLFMWVAILFNPNDFVVKIYISILVAILFDPKEFLVKFYIQLRADAMVHFKYWFRISSILEKTKNRTKTSNTSFGRSDSGLLKSWSLGAWQHHGLATPSSLQDFESQLSDLSTEVLFVFVLFLVPSKIDEMRDQYLRCTIASARNCTSKLIIVDLN